jgi:hypothetical protein
MSVVAVAAHHIVVVAQRRNCTDGHSFLPDIEMAEAADLSERVRFTGTFLEPADQA